jgi:purine-binding chemotaxis protein CheW
VVQSPSEAGLHLVFTVQSVACALPIDGVVETMRPLPVTRVDRAPRTVLGVALVRGVPTPVVDASRLLGVAGDVPPGRFLTLAVNGRQVSLAVTSVSGVRALGARSFSAMPPLLAKADGDAVAAIGALDQDLMMLLGGARIVPDDVFAALPSGAEA